MAINKERYTKHFNSLDTNQQIELCKKTGMDLHKIKKRYDKACQACQEYTGIYTGKGKGSTLYANREKIAVVYQDTKDMFKLFSQLL